MVQNVARHTSSLQSEEDAIEGAERARDSASGVLALLELISSTNHKVQARVSVNGDQATLGGTPLGSKVEWVDHRSSWTDK